MQWDRWIEKGRFPIGDQIGHSYAVEKVPFRSQLSDGAIRSAHPVEKLEFLTGCADRNARSEIFEAHRISHHPIKHTSHPTNSSDAGLTATTAAAAAAHSQSAWHILFSARQQRIPSSDGSSACYR